jgi:hypothetical protein
MTGGQAAARGLSVVVFLMAALIAFFGAIVDNALLVFAGANVAAAGLAALGGRSIATRIAGALSLLSALLLMNEHAGSSEAARSPGLGARASRKPVWTHGSDAVCR